MLIVSFLSVAEPVTQTFPVGPYILPHDNVNAVYFLQHFGNSFWMAHSLPKNTSIYTFTCTLRLSEVSL